MKSLYEKLNRLDDSLVESKRVVKKKKLTESVEDDKKKLFDAAASVKCKLDDDTIEYAMYDVDDFIENELVYCGKLLLSECPDMLFWRYVSDENFGSYCAVYESDEEFADAFYQISHDRVYDITDEVNGDYDYDDDIDEMLTEGNNVTSQVPPAIDNFLQDIAQMYRTITYKDIMEHEYTEEDLKKLKNYRRRFRAESPYEGDEEADKVLKDVANRVAQLVKSENMLESRNNPYFAPYGYRDAAKVLNGDAPEYYYHLKEIEMDRCDGVRLARYAMRKGLPVMVDKNSDPDYPEFAIKGEYHWDDYFYPYPTAHEEDLVAWDGKMFVEEQLTESENSVTLESIANQIVEYAKEHPDTLKNSKYMYDYIDNLSQEGRFEIPAKVGQFVLEDPENVTEFEAEEFINILLNDTDVGDKLLEVKRAAQRSAWNELRNRSLSI